MPGFGHAESAADAALLDRISGWVREVIPVVASPVASPAASSPTAAS